MLITFSFSCPTKAQDLIFNSTPPIYPTGALSNSYPSVGTPAVSVDVAVSPAGNFQFSTPTPSTTGLQITVNFPNNTSQKTITVTFGSGVSNLSFSIFGIEQGAAYQDQVTVTATKNSLAPISVNPAITPSAYATVAGNVITGKSNDPGSAASTVAFGDFVQKLTIVYGNGPASSANPSAQGITIGNLTWSAPLPVTLLSFTAKPEGDRVQLAWATTSERDADRFVVERSADLSEYVSVGEVTAKGTTDARQYYGLTDRQPLPGNNYYRLRQIDLDGTSHTFKPVAAVVTVDDVVATVYPNPADPTRIHLRLWNADAGTVRLLTLSGQLVESRLERRPGEADLIPQDPLTAGLYWVDVQTNGQRRVSKVVVK